MNVKTDGEGYTERYHFGAFDLLECLERADGSQLTFRYDRLLRLVCVTNALGETYRYERDLAGQIVREIDFTGRVQTYQYDAIGRRIRTDYPDGAYITFEYNAQDALIRQTHYQAMPPGLADISTDDILYEYDSQGRLTKATNRDAEIAYQYDAQGRLLSESLNGRETVYQYDETGTRIVGGLREGVHVSMAYDARDGLASWQVNEHHPLAFLYSARGQELARTSQAGFSQLSRYTEVGVQENGFRPRTYFYYWNALNQLVRFSNSQGDAWHYRYDAFGRRVQKLRVMQNGNVPGQNTPKHIAPPKVGYDYYYLGDQLIEEAPIYADGTVAFEHSTHWLYAPNQLTPTARYQQSQLNYVITDPLDTPTELLAEDGTGRWSVKHHLWGSILKQYSANDDDYCNLRFPGQYADSESGLHYNRYRYYDPNTAQYLTPDPIGSACCHGKTPNANLVHYSGTEKPLTRGATPNSIYIHVDPRTGKVVQNAIYDSNGDVIGHVDFKNHGIETSGHYHQFPEPGNPASGHGTGKPHYPNSTMPSDWDVLPPNLEPYTPIGQ